MPEALVNLGIAYERKGDPLKALDAWRRARKAGVRFAPLADWIESKERIYGGGAVKRLAIAAALVLRARRSVAHADNVTVGLFAPTRAVPVDGRARRARDPARRARSARRSAAPAAAGSTRAAADFAAAVKKGEVTVALVDAAYLAGAGGNYTVIAARRRATATSTHGWQLVARGARRSSPSSRASACSCPASAAARPTSCSTCCSAARSRSDFFAKIEAAPDTASALAALGLGKADAAVVPAGVELPAGTAEVLALPALVGPGARRLRRGDAAAAPGAAAAAASFKGDATVAGVPAPAMPTRVRAIARRFARPVKRGPLVVPAVRLVVGDLVEGRTFAIERTPASAFVAVPGAK